MVHFLELYRYWLIFGLVLAENLGLPLPSYPVLLLAASVTRTLHFSLVGLLLISMMGALAGDMTWYLLGRLRGRPILRILCSLTLNPDSCVSRTENIFVRHGLKSLLVAKFVPGLNTIAPPLAGMLRISALRFALYDLAGIAIWASSALGLGIIFRTQVEWVLEWLQNFGRLGGLILAVLIAGWLLLKWVERRQFYKILEKSRISPPELKEMLSRGDNVVIVDLRSNLSYQTEGTKIPGAIHIPPREFEARYKEIPPGRPVVMYCT
jgi:membrane protein DedA with SNARE-associated domain